MERTLISPANARYIKLGKGGAWEAKCLEEGTIRLGYYEVPHDLGLKADKSAIREIYLATHDAGKATGHANQFLDFYTLDESTLWLTFSAGHLWWCFARKEVEFLGNDPEHYPEGSRFRRTLNPWSNKSLAGKSLRISELNGALTTTGGYRQAICMVKGRAFEYLVNKINDKPIAEVKNAEVALRNAEAAAESLVRILYWPDFELLVDLIFSHSGWQRVSVVGGDQKTTDIQLTLPSTGETAMVQVKSATTQKQLDEYLERFTEWNIERLFYVYHTSATELLCTNLRVTLIGSKQIGSMVVKSGLLEWLLRKVG